MYGLFTSTYGFFDIKNKETLKQKNLQALLMRIEEFSKDCSIIEASNWI